MKQCMAIILTLTMIFSLGSCSSGNITTEQKCKDCGKGISVTALFCQYCGVGVTASNNEIETAIKVPNSALHYLTSNFDLVVSELKAAGFSNIQTVSKGDLTSLSAIEDGTVSEISIDGNYSFKEDEEFPKDAEVVVTYHSIPKVKVPISAENRHKVDCETLVAMFLDAGFINVTAEEVIDLDPDTTDAAFKNEVTIGVNSQFLEGSEFPFDTEVSIVCHKPFVKHKVKLNVNFISNLFFNKYDVTVLVDGVSQRTLDHGETFEFELSLKEGTHTLEFQKDGDSAIVKKVTLDIKQATKASYEIMCFSDKITAEKEYVKELKDLDENGVAYSGNLTYFAGLPDKSACIDELVEVTGEYTGNIIGMYLIGEVGDDFWIAFSFKEETNAVKQLEEGDIITVRGECTDYRDDSLALKNCELISDTKPEPAMPPILSESNKAQVPLAASKCVGKNYEEVIGTLTAAGFSNIKANPIYDIYFGLTREKSIKTISINGNNEFQSGDIFDKESEIIIVYHMPQDDDPSRIKMLEDSSAYVGMNYKDVEQVFKSLGFTDITLSQSTTEDTSYTDGEVYSVKAGAWSFDKGDSFEPDAFIIINYYMVEEPVYISMPQNGGAYVRMNYLEVERIFKDLGFTNIRMEEKAASNSSYANGDVFSVMVNSKYFEQGDSFEPEDEVLIKYCKLNMTIENNTEFASLMRLTDHTAATRGRSFAITHIGDVIEFDGCIAFVMNHGDYKTRFDVCMAGGDYDSDRVYGPLFAFENVAFYDMKVSGADEVARGMNFHITAEIKGYNSEGAYIILEPVSMKAR